MIGSQRRVAWFSPLRGKGVSEESLSAYFTEKLLPVLENHLAIDVYQAERAHLGKPGTYHFLEAARKHAANPYDLFFYQVEDKECSRFVRSCLGHVPGVVLFHDVLMTKPPPVSLLKTPWRQVVRGFENPQTLVWPTETEWDLNDSPFALRECAFAALPLFSHSWAHDTYRSESARDGDVNRINRVSCNGASYSLELPFTLAQQTSKDTKTPLTIGIVSAGGTEGRGSEIFQALSKIDLPFRVLWLLHEGVEQQCVHELAEEFGIEVEHVSFRSPDKWASVVVECDIAFHLHYSVYGNLNPYVEMSCAAGSVVAVLNFGLADYVGGENVVRIEPGEGEVRQIRELLCAVARELPLMRSRQKTHSTVTPQEVAEELLVVFEKHGSQLRDVSQRWAEVKTSAERYLQSGLNDWYRARFDLLPEELATKVAYKVCEQERQLFSFP
jgi:hypothetical protein